MGKQYDDEGNLGTYQTSAEPFPDPQGLKRFAGYGADKADLAQGFIRPEMRELPEYEKANYHEKWSQERTTDTDDPLEGFLGKDYKFREKDVETKGLLKRPRIPTER